MRPAYSPVDLAGVYPAPHQHAPHKSHHLRVAHTVNMANQLMVEEKGRSQWGYSVADLACGDAFIPKSLCREPILGDFAAGYQFHGLIEETIELIGPVDLFVFTEIAEHLDNPDKVLGQIRQKAGCLIMSTPVDEDPRTAHEEHYWSWDMTDVRDMLLAAGWTPLIYGCDIMPDAQFQYWACT